MDISREAAGFTSRWNTEKNKIVSITRAGVRFERKPDAAAAKETDNKPPTKVQAVDLPARLYTMLNVLIVIGVALLALALLRR